MKLLKKLSAIILTIVLLFSGIPMAEVGLDSLFAATASAAALKEGDKNCNDFVYTYADSTQTEIKIVKYMGGERDVTVPSFIEGLPVTQLDSYSFSTYTYNNYKNPDCLYIETVALPDSITTIRDNAFYDCRYLYSINMPTELEVIGEKAFMYCYSLEKLDLSDGIVDCGEDVFFGTAIKKLDIGSKNKTPYLNIHDYFLRGSNIEELTVSSEYIWFYDNSLFSDSLKTVTIRGTVEQFESDVFGDAKVANLPKTINFYNSFNTTIYSVLETKYGYFGEVSEEDENWVTFTKSNITREILTDSDYQYYINKSGEAVISKYVGAESDIVVPEKLGGVTVTTIGYDSFRKRGGISSVTLPDTVKYIQSNAFRKCENMTTINVGSGIKNIGFGAFYGCIKLQEIVLPKAVTAIAGYTFYDCNKLTSIQAPGVTSVMTSSFDDSGVSEIEFSENFDYIESFAFNECHRLRDFKYDKNVTYLGEFAFFGSRVESFEFNDEITEIPLYAFGEADELVSVVFPSNLEIIGDCAFESCNELEQIELPLTVTTIGIGAFRYCSALNGTLTIPETITSIGNSAFFSTGYTTLNYNSPSPYNNNIFGMSKLTTVNIGSCITEIPNGMFFSCTQIRHITIPDTVTKIGGGAFEDCINLESITISANLSVIEAEAFKNCEKLTTITLPDSVTEIGEKAFIDCDKLTELTIPKNVTTFYVNAFPQHLTTVYYNAENCTFEGLVRANSGNTYYSPFYGTMVRNVIIGDTVKRIPEYFFCHVSYIEDIVLPDSVTEIGTEAFCYSSIKNITLSANLIIIEDRAFYGTNVKIKGNTFPEGMRMIGKEAFAYCHEIEEICLPDSVVDVAECAFEGSKKLSKVKMSSNVRLIAERAFYGCNVLSDFEWDSDIKLIADRAFFNCRALTNFDFTGVELLYPNSFTYTGVTLVTLGENQKEEATNLIAIETQSFMDCESLETVSIGGNVTTIKSEAFASCSSLETAVISDSVINIAPDAFDDCNSLTIYCEEDSYAHKYAVKNNIPVSTFVVAPIPNQTYTGSAIEPEIDVSVSGEKVMENTDFTVKYSNNINVGTAKVTVSGKGVYKVLSSVANFTIITKSIAPVTFAAISEQDYTGEAVIPTITVTDGNRVLKEGVDYTVTYKNNVNEGTATVTIQGIGNYHGTASTNFEIREMSTSQSIGNTIIDFFTSLWLRIVSFFTSIFS